MNKLNNKITVYRVYDDEWEQIMGIGQLKEFAIYRLSEDNIYNDVEDLLSYDYKHTSEIIELIKQLENGETISDKDIPVEVLIEILNYGAFDVEELNLY